MSTEWTHVRLRRSTLECLKIEMAHMLREYDRGGPIRARADADPINPHHTGISMDEVVRVLLDDRVRTRERKAESARKRRARKRGEA